MWAALGTRSGAAACVAPSPSEIETLPFEAQDNQTGAAASSSQIRLGRRPPLWSDLTRPRLRTGIARRGVVLYGRRDIPGHDLRG